MSMIKKVVIILLLILLNHLANAQDNIDQAIVKLYPQTINDFFSANISYNKQSFTKNALPEFLLINKQLPDNLPLIYKNFTLKIVKDQNDAIKQLEKEHKKQGTVYVIERKFKSDTLDITIGGWAILIRKGIFIKNAHLFSKKITITASCGGTSGYIPSGRYVYSLNSWKYISFEQMLAEYKGLKVYQ